MFYHTQVPSRFLSSEIHSSQVEDEPDTPPVTFVAVTVLLSFAVVVIVIIFAYILLFRSTAEVKDQADTGSGNQVRLEYLQQQREILETYAQQEDGSYRIPVTEAMKNVVAEQKKS